MTQTALSRFAMLVVGLLLAGHAGTAQSELRVSPTGEAQMVFLQSRDACQRQDLPDSAARAFRDASGQVHLFASHFINFAFIGPSLDEVKRNCQIVYEGANSADPARFDDRSWLHSFWTDDGQTIYALIDNEFQGHLRPELCPSRSYNGCWYNSITFGISTDQGFRFSRIGAAAVAAPINRYVPDIGRPTGYFGVSNIVKQDGFYFAFIWAENIGTQVRGNCLFRTDDLTRAESWRAWDGQGFNVQLSGVYTETPGSGATQGCAPIEPARLNSHIVSLVRHLPTGRYLAVMANEGSKPTFFYAESADLMTWTNPRTLVDIPLSSIENCPPRPERAYPSIIDPNSPSRNFETVGDTAYVYFTKFNYSTTHCGQMVTRDLMRIPLAITNN